MLLSFLIAAALFAGSHAVTVSVVDPAGLPVAATVVTFSDGLGDVDRESTDMRGETAARSGFAPLSADVSAVGFHLLRSTCVRYAFGSCSVGGRLSSELCRWPPDRHTSFMAFRCRASYLDVRAVRSSAAATTDALLRGLAGVDRTRSNSDFTNYGQLRASFGGAGADRGLVLVDGIPAQDAFGGQIDWAAYPVREIERAELLRGAGSALYGAGAAAGVLELTTFGPQPA
ncbi:MAG: Plug domain-containing protein [Candidatus Eremiobacteraeota bacterium]|nr:Plug domain-containing protein [Candidatus Eremiobacteraeota bacterium]MBC5827347.1 Plug domain-containing protein [Candidatus Eremiobacteraeota bacterium]